MMARYALDVSFKRRSSSFLRSAHHRFPLPLLFFPFFFLSEQFPAQINTNPINPLARES
jgi:hypothetical protein